MPAKIELDENLRFLYICLQKSDMKAIDFAAVGDATNLKSPAARMRYTRLKQQVESGNLFAASGVPSVQGFGGPGLEGKKRKRDTGFENVEDLYGLEDNYAGRVWRVRSPSRVKVERMMSPQPPTTASNDLANSPPAGPKTTESRPIKLESGTKTPEPIVPQNNSKKTTPNAEDSEDEMPLAKLRKGIQRVSLGPPNSHYPNLYPVPIPHQNANNTQPPTNNFNKPMPLSSSAAPIQNHAQRQRPIPPLNLPKPSFPSQIRPHSHSQSHTKIQGRRQPYMHLHLPKPRPNHNLRPPIYQPPTVSPSSSSQLQSYLQSRNFQLLSQSSQSLAQAQRRVQAPHPQSQAQSQPQNRPNSPNRRPSQPHQQAQIQTRTPPRNQIPDQPQGNVDSHGRQIHQLDKNGLSRHFRRFLDPVGNQNRYYGQHDVIPNSKEARGKKKEKQNQASNDKADGWQDKGSETSGRGERGDGHGLVYPFHAGKRSEGFRVRDGWKKATTSSANSRRVSGREGREEGQINMRTQGQSQRPGQWRRLDGRGDRFGWVFDDEFEGAGRV